MNDPIDTEVSGAPAQIHSLADTLRTAAHPAIAATGDQLVRARRDTHDAWDSPAGEAFYSTVSGMITPVDELETYLGEAASGLEHLASDLRLLTNVLADIRDGASEAGLTVNGFIIAHPGPAVPAPGPLSPDAQNAEALVHRQQLEAHDAQNARLDAYSVAAADASDVRSREAAAVTSWSDTAQRKQNIRLAFSGAEFGVGGLATGAIELRGRIHRQRARTLLDRSAELARNSEMTRDYDARRASSKERSALHRRAYNHQEVFRSSNSLSQKFAIRGGGALAIGGVAYDIVVLDKPWHEAAVTGTVSFGASVAAGAVVGSMIPVPVVGTVAGAATGAVVGIFTSGMIEGLFDDGSSGVGHAVAAGGSAVTNAWNTAGDGMKSVWNALF